MAAEQIIPSASVPLSEPGPKLTWPRAAGGAALALYGPQLLMCLYTVGFVSCSHCKTGVWPLAPIAPGLFIYEWGRHLLNVPRFSDAVGITLTIVLSLLIVVGFTAWLRGLGRWWWALMIPMALASGFIAFAILGAMRA